ncbi:glycoside hydrolase family 3 C-terminal domain-containing protein [Candidatus Bathyarchaeota archaeon]|nr:glycoside hydrolase family 3 C-terminal domain-containing protein [Candidatus Bathyarchaeota archaeon]MBS7613596.1 glycoside hydrolase family 3 C-terminal domain-containing protein [Candidatus Bathyarchaeota archaeon]MBS7617090.1 glycoside hydrolase family 3 C-terminal domain-containing protein [Candidatus Bathyarchaeota archaeon]
MTLEEKIGQLCQYSGFTSEYEKMIIDGRIGSLLNVFGAEETNRVQNIAVEKTRLGIPLMFGLDVIHGYKTIFPIPLGLASTFDPDLVRKTASIAATEAAAEGVHWTFAPMVDIARDPRWGRIAEGAGEDPYLGSVMAKTIVEGFQGRELSDLDTVVACPKHYVAYGGAEGGRDYNTVDVSERTLREIYLPPFKAAVEAGAGTIMSAFNDLNGIPASANPFTLKTILRDEWGFEGFVVSDWNAIGELINHGIAGDIFEAAEKALKAGVDMDMQGDVYRRTLLQLVKDGRVSEERINEAVKRILKIKFRLGLFERPYVDPERAKRIVKCREHVEAALEIARKSIVLLKNDGCILPLSRNIESIAVIGPLADDREAPLGPWSCLGDPKDVVTVLEGIKSRASAETRALYAKGCDIEGESTEGFKEAVEKARKCKVAIVVVGESRNMSGEAACRAFLGLPGVQEELVKAVYETGVPTVEVLMNGRPLSISWSAEHIPAIVEAWFPGIQAGYAIADVLFGNYNPGGKLPVTFPRTVGQVPIYYNHKNTGRPPSPDRWTSKYLDIPYTPLFPFGHGLSYTKFEYSDLEVSPSEVKPEDQVKIKLKVKNIGDREGDEVVQLYVNDIVASVTRPVKELKGFKRITLKPSEETIVEFTLTLEMLSFLNREMRRVVEPGLFKVMVGSSSEDIQLTGTFTVKNLVEFPWK